MSDSQKKYLKKQKQNIIWVKVTQILIIVFLLGLWELLARYKLINTFIFSSPSLVIQTINDLIKSNNFFIHIWTTFYETMVSFVLGTIIGLFIASGLWWNSFFAKVFSSFLIVLNSLPKVALGPIIIIWAGANIKSIIIMALLISTIITILNIYESFKTTDKIKIKLMKSFNATKWQIFYKLVLPSNYSAIISTLKINVSMSLIGIIMGEFLVSKRGLGYLIMYGSQVFNLNLVITGIFILAILSITLYILVTRIEKRLQK